jgi:hypothetical protein
LPMLWGEGGGLGARPEGVPRAGEPQEKELCAGPPAALGYVDGSGGCGSVLPGGLRVGAPVTDCRSTTTTTTTTTPPSNTYLAIPFLNLQHNVDQDKITSGIVVTGDYQKQEARLRLLFSSDVITQTRHGRMARGGHGLPKVSRRPDMPYPSTPCGRATP